MLHCWADGKGGQKIEDTGPLTKKRMETIDDEVTEHALAFIDKVHKDGQAVLPLVQHHGHALPDPLRREAQGQERRQGDYNDVMVAHDENIGRMLAKLDELGIADDTIVMYSTDNGPHYNSWPDAGITPFRSEKNTNWEGGWRVPIFVRWPGKIKPGSVLNDICLPPGLAADAPRRRGRTGHRGEAARRPQGRRQDLQGAHRRLQPAALSDRRGEGEPAKVLLLHQR